MTKAIISRLALFAIAMVGVVALLGGCDSEELTSSKLKKILLKSKSLQPKRVMVAINEDSFLLGRAKRWWDGPSILPKGSKFFTLQEDSQSRPVGGLWTTMDIAPEIVEVASVADRPEKGPDLLFDTLFDDQVAPGDRMKTVAFKWRYNWDRLPREIKKFITENAANTETYFSTAKLRLYQDGWRIADDPVPSLPYIHVCNQFLYPPCVPHRMADLPLK